MSLHYHGILGFKSSIFVGLRIHGDAHLWGLLSTKTSCPCYMVRRKNWPKHIHCFAFQPLIIKICQSRKYFEADVSILGFRIPSVGFLVVVKDPSTVLESQYSARTPGVIGCNLIWLGYEEFRKVFGFEAFETFWYPKEVHPLIFAQMCTLYHQSKDQDVQPDTHTSNGIQQDNQPVNEIHATTSNINCNSIPEDLSPPDATLKQVWIGNPLKVICIPANSVKVVEGKTSSKARWLSCMIQARSQNNLPLGGHGQPYRSYSQQKQ